MSKVSDIEGGNQPTDSIIQGEDMYELAGSELQGQDCAAVDKDCTHGSLELSLNKSDRGLGTLHMLVDYYVQVSSRHCSAMT